MTLLQTRDLRVEFHQRNATVHALDGVDLELQPGQRLGLVGGSGSGKTTLARCLVGLQRATSGEIRFDGGRVGTEDTRGWEAVRRRVSMVFQDPNSSLNPRMRLVDIITEPLRQDVGRGAPRLREAATRALESVALDDDMLGRFPHELSGGQRQRVAIARALVNEPDVLIADEPVSALDVSVRAQIIALLREAVQRRALTLLFVSHDLGVVRHLCSDVLVMSEGQVVERGRTPEVLGNPKHHYTAALVDASLSL